MSYSANEAVQITFRHDEKEFLAATRLYFWRSKQLITRLAVVDVLFAILALLLNVLVDFIVPLWALAAMIVLAWVAWYHGLVVELPRRRFRGDPKFRDEFTLTFTDAKIEFKTENVNATFAWNFYTGVIEDDNFYLLTYGKNIHSYSVIPKHAFRDPHDEAMFRRLLRRNLDPNLKLGAGEQETTAYVPRSTTNFQPPDWR